MMFAEVTNVLTRCANPTTLELVKDDFIDTLKILRDKNFQNLLVNYQRAKRSFWVAYEAQDDVSSERLSRFGQFDKPEDYLNAFSSFVKEHTDKINALHILFESPRQWRTEVLEELQQKLKEHDYDVKNLREAHRIVYHKALADIISMVKHAVREEEPLLTAEERVGRAVQKIVQSKSFTDEQLKWLSLIQEHLVQNLTIEEDDFASLPIFERLGGIGKARKVFGNQLQPLIEELNLAIAA